MSSDGALLCQHWTGPPTVASTLWKASSASRRSAGRRVGKGGVSAPWLQKIGGRLGERQEGRERREARRLVQQRRRPWPQGPRGAEEQLAATQGLGLLLADDTLWSQNAIPQTSVGENPAFTRLKSEAPRCRHRRRRYHTETRRRSCVCHF